MKEYEWDSEKRELNLKKHGIDFIDAVEVFDDPDRIAASSIRKGEERFEAIGMLHDIVIFVAYAIRKNKKRIISS